MEKLPDHLKNSAAVMTNFQSVTLFDGNTTLNIEAIPMYNLREEASQYHPKGRGNGYVITLGTERIYISGDTEDIPEMRNLKNIDIAFVCMNLPYTMTVERAADAVLDFKPKTVFPYHYRGTDGLSDVSLFKTLVNSKNKDIEVVQLDWYN
jgi:L-ascorbate metabolism protein UlaG (beta-lactamase superfamily)